MSGKVLDYYSAEEINRILKYSSNLVVKQKQKSNKYETSKSVETGNILKIIGMGYPISFLSTNDLTLKLSEAEIQLFIDDYHLNTSDIYSMYKTYTDNAGNSFTELQEMPVKKSSSSTTISSRSHSFFESNLYYVKLFLTKGVNILTARNGRDYDIIHETDLSSLDTNTRKIFYETFQANRDYYVRNLFNPSFMFEKEYDNFNCFFITIMTLIEVLGDKVTDLFNVDTLNSYHISNLLYSYDITFMDEVPLHYKRKLLRNLNFLINNKGSNVIFTTVLSIFGFKNSKVFKYYLAKTFKKGDDGFYDFTDPDLVFYKVPIESLSIEEAFKKNEIDELTFESVIAGDKYWKASKAEVLQKEFNHANSKYYDIVTAIDMQRVSTNLSYFYDALSNVEYNFKDAPFEVMEFNSRFSKNGNNTSLFDLFIAVNILSLFMIGFESNIYKTPSDVRAIALGEIQIYSETPQIGNSFPETIDLSRLTKPTRDLLGSDLIYSMSQLKSITNKTTFVEMFDANLKLKEAIEEAIKLSSDYDEVQMLEEDYKYLFFSTLNRLIFKEHTTYLSYLYESSPGLADEISIAINSDFAKQEGENLLIEVLSVIEKLLDSENINFFAISQRYIINYARKLIEYFKSYTIQLRSFSVFYRFDTYDEYLKILDKPFYDGNTDVTDSPILFDSFTPHGSYQKSSKLNMLSDQFRLKVI
jgi:hypothetical protein